MRPLKHGLFLEDSLDRRLVLLEVAGARRLPIVVQEDMEGNNRLQMLAQVAHVYRHGASTQDKEAAADGQVSLEVDYEGQVLVQITLPVKHREYEDSRDQPHNEIDTDDYDEAALHHN